MFGKKYTNCAKRVSGFFEEKNVNTKEKLLCLTCAQKEATERHELEEIQHKKEQQERINREKTFTLFKDDDGSFFIKYVSVGRNERTIDLPPCVKSPPIPCVSIGEGGIFCGDDDPNNTDFKFIQDFMIKYYMRRSSIRGNTMHMGDSYFLDTDSINRDFRF